MELPIENRLHAIRKVIKLMILLCIIIAVIFIINFRMALLYYSIPVLFIATGISYWYINKHNISKAYLRDNHIELIRKHENIKIPLDKVREISSGINDYISIHGKMSVLYSFDLKEKYSFGDRLYFKFNDRMDPTNDPDEIKIIKGKIGELK
jgi:hypothetical protein